jgi:hypothetical protein
MKKPKRFKWGDKTYYCRGRECPLIGLELGGKYFNCGYAKDEPQWRKLG